MKCTIAQAEIISLKKHIFSHLAELPPHSIAHATVIISYTDDHKDAFKKLTNFERSPTFTLPKLVTLKDSTKIIDPTDALLKYEKGINFVTMKYILKMIDKVKFVFAFDAQETRQKPIDNIKQMALNFLSLFSQLHGDAIKDLAKSCCIMIMNTEPHHTIKTYKYSLVGQTYKNGVLEQGYIGLQSYSDIKVIFQDIFMNERVILCNSNEQKQKSIEASFINMNNRLNFFTLSQQYHTNVPIQNYLQFAALNPGVWQQWAELFKLLLDNFDTIITQQPQPISNAKKQMPQLLRNKQQALKKHGTIFIQKILEQFIIKYDDNKPNKLSFTFTFQRLLYLINELFAIFGPQRKLQAVVTFEEHRQMLFKLTTVLWQSGYIPSLVRYYFQSYYNIHKCLSEKSQVQNNLFHRIYFFESIQKFFQSIKVIINHFFAALEQELDQISLSFNFKKALTQLNSIITIIENNPMIFFASPIISKKVKKYRFILLYKWLCFSRNKADKADTITKSIILLEYSLEIEMIESEIMVEICTGICQELSQFDEFQELILELYKMMPQYDIYDKVIAIYERKFNTNIELFPYLSHQEWERMVTHYFQEYCVFLMKIGLQQKVRELCLQALKRCKDSELRKVIALLFSRARSNQFQELHDSFISESILQQKQIVVESQFVGRLKQKCMESKLLLPNFL